MKFDWRKSQRVPIDIFFKPEKKHKLKQELGCKPTGTFESGIRKTVEWYLANSKWVANMQSGAYRDWVTTQYAANY